MVHESMNECSVIVLVYLKGNKNMEEELFSAGTTLQGRDHMKEKEERRRKTKERGSKKFNELYKCDMGKN
jgi:hypothetical protein